MARDVVVRTTGRHMTQEAWPALPPLCHTPELLRTQEVYTESQAVLNIQLISGVWNQLFVFHSKIYKSKALIVLESEGPLKVLYPNNLSLK